jgi:hypothetical protein
MGTGSFAPSKSPPVSASKAEDGMPQIVLIRIWTGPLGLMMGGLDVGWLCSVYRVTQHLRTRKSATETKEKPCHLHASEWWQEDVCRDNPKLFTCICCVFSGLCLLIGDFIECWKDGGIYWTCITEKIAWDGLDILGGLFEEFWSLIQSIMCLLTIEWSISRDGVLDVDGVADYGWIWQVC